MNKKIWTRTNPLVSSADNSKGKHITPNDQAPITNKPNGQSGVRNVSVFALIMLTLYWDKP